MKEYMEKAVYCWCIFIITFNVKVFYKALHYIIPFRHCNNTDIHKDANLKMRIHPFPPCHTMSRNYNIHREGDKLVLFLYSRIR